MGGYFAIVQKDQVKTVRSVPKDAAFSEISERKSEGKVRLQHKLLGNLKWEAQSFLTQSQKILKNFKHNFITKVILLLRTHKQHG